MACFARAHSQHKTNHLSLKNLSLISDISYNFFNVCDQIADVWKLITISLLLHTYQMCDLSYSENNWGGCLRIALFCLVNIWQRCLTVFVCFVYSRFNINQQRLAIHHHHPSKAYKIHKTWVCVGLTLPLSCRPSLADRALVFKHALSFEWDQPVDYPATSSFLACPLPNLLLGDICTVLIPGLSNGGRCMYIGSGYGRRQLLSVFSSC